jgi:acylphosphatase
MSDTKYSTCRWFRITGRVQGVFFRASVRNVAIQLSLTGYARNLADGAVEVFACGRVGAINKLEAWLQHGPRMASVTNVEIKSAGFRKIDCFSIV